MVRNDKKLYNQPVRNVFSKHNNNKIVVAYGLHCKAFQNLGEGLKIIRIFTNGRRPENMEIRSFEKIVQMEKM